MKRHKGREARCTNLVLCMWLVLSGLLISGCVPDEEPVDYEAILSRVHEGDERQQMLQALSDAWYHSECRYPDGAVDDMFLYGPKDRDKVTIIIIRSKPEGAQLFVDQVGSLESYFLNDPDFGGECEPPLQEAFE
jgi:hypothetical protein